MEQAKGGERESREREEKMERVDFFFCWWAFFGSPCRINTKSKHQRGERREKKERGGEKEQGRCKRRKERRRSEGGVSGRAYVRRSPGTLNFPAFLGPVRAEIWSFSLQIWAQTSSNSKFGRKHRPRPQPQGHATAAGGRSGGLAGGDAQRPPQHAAGVVE